jgi:hypothetical protein
VPLVSEIPWDHPERVAIERLLTEFLATRPGLPVTVKIARLDGIDRWSITVATEKWVAACSARSTAGPQGVLWAVEELFPRNG